MTLKVDGTNGVLQAYDYQVLTTGFSYTFAAGTQTLVINPAGTLATGTVTMPASPVDGMVITVESTQQITALTIAANTGQTMVGGTVTLRPNQPLSFMYRLANTTWYPFAGSSNSQLLLGTSVSLSGATTTFTGIPSWVKRITIMFYNMSSTTSSNMAFRIGSGSLATTGYVNDSGYLYGPGSSGVLSDSTVLVQVANAAAAAVASGTLTLNRFDGNTWVSTLLFSQTGPGLVGWGSGWITLGGALDQVGVTNLSGTFDSGTMNIMYE